ncbi:MAG: M48 family metallopeptidase [Synechococcaceae cyanobacterium SM2_3_1]|nr:M48 family metallopeptidase [Synechococcaceae cyanobacterium SM2_3_1]
MVTGLPPLNYRVRQSRRARYVRLQVTSPLQVDIIVPWGFDQSQIPGILQEKQPWITRTLQRLQQQQRWIGLDPAEALPTEIGFQAVDQRWSIEFQSTSAPRLILEETSHGVMIMGAIQEASLCRELLRQWLIRQGYIHLQPWLQSVSQELRMPFHRCRIRCQKTRWGSCSSHGTISLNAKLLFLPPTLVRYVFIHELCHTVHLNHSTAFWDLVSQHQPDYRHLSRQLRQAQVWIPAWVNGDE